MYLAAFYFSWTYAHRISLRIIIKDYIITQALINETALKIANLIGFAIAYPKQQFKETVTPKLAVLW